MTTIGRTDTAAYTFVAIANGREIEDTISAPNEKIARREFFQGLSSEERDAVEEVELVDIDRFFY